MENQIDPEAAVAVDDVLDDRDDDLGDDPQDDNTDWKAEASKARGIATRRGNKIQKLKDEIQTLKTPAPTPSPDSNPKAATPAKQAGELDEIQLEVLELRGITENEDITVIQSVMKNTGKSLRDAMKDEYVVSKLAANKQKRDTIAATPTATRRSGQNPSNDLDYWLAENERTGKLPDDFELRSKVIETKTARGSNTTPPWRK